MPEDPQYVPRKVVDASYRPKSYLMSPGLLRAREPFRVRNALTGLTLAAVGVGIWAYSIGAVKQNAFDDVDEEARALAVARLAEDKRKAAMDPLPVEASAPVVATQPNTEGRRGLLVKLLDGAFPQLFDPSGKTLIWGAPSVDSFSDLEARK